MAANKSLIHIKIAAKGEILKELIAKTKNALPRNSLETKVKYNYDVCNGEGK